MTIQERLHVILKMHHFLIDTINLNKIVDLKKYPLRFSSIEKYTSAI